MNPLLNSVLEQFSVEVSDLMRLLENKRITPLQWRDRMAMLLARYHQAAMMVGMGTTAVPPEGVLLLRQSLQDQYRYLENFFTEVAAAEAFKQAWLSRAQMYTQSAGASFWDGYIYRQAGQFLPIPAVPKDGTTQCLSNCKCELVVTVLDKAAGDFDVYWKLNPAEHCQTCVERAEQWNPLKIRGGVLLLGGTAVKHLGGQHDQQTHGRGGAGKPFSGKVYHGSGGEIYQFDLDHFSSGTDAGKMGEGVYFSADKNIARSYALMVPGRPTVHTVDIALKNPLRLEGNDIKSIVSSTGKRMGVNALPSWDGFKQTNFDFSSEFTRAAQRLGHDGVLWYRNGKLAEIVSFDPYRQIGNIQAESI